MSISLNIAEGGGKITKNEKKRYYSIARGSALECAAIFDVLTSWELLRSSDIQEARVALESIVAILSSLVLKTD